MNSEVNKPRAHEYPEVTCRRWSRNYELDIGVRYRRQSLETRIGELRSETLGEKLLSQKGEGFHGELDNTTAGNKRDLDFLCPLLCLQYSGLLAG